MTDPEDRDCGTCLYYNSLDGWCRFWQTEQDYTQEPCEEWVDWETEFRGE